MHRVLAAASRLIMLILGSAVHAQPYDAIHAFGDNYTAITGGPYFQGRWCNGLVWPEYLAGKWNLSNQSRNNRAQGLATSQTVLSQIRTLSATSLENSLCLVFAGAIDFGSAFRPEPIASGWNIVASQVLGNCSNAMLMLQDKGARTLAVLNQPDFMRFPQFAALPPQDKAFYRRATIQFNRDLDAMLLQMTKSQQLAARVAVVDTFSLLEAILDQPEAYGFTEAVASAVHDPRLTNKAFDGPGRNYVFWDPVSVTTRVQAMVANWTDAALAGTSLSLNRSDGAWVLSADRLLVGRSFVLQSSSDAHAWSEIQTDFALYFQAELLSGFSADGPAQLFRLQYLAPSPDLLEP